MKFYKVWVSSPSYHGKEPLTYSSESAFDVGDIVGVPLQNRIVNGVIAAKVGKPTFATKDMTPLPVSARIPRQSLELISWLISYYPAPSGQIVSLFLPSVLSQKSRSKSDTKESIYKIPPLPKLTSEQVNVVDKINNAKDNTVLLHGDTGTGKTRVYLELTRQVIESGKSALILTPEIGLTPQLLATFSSQFPGKTAIIHSHLTPAQRRNSWLRIAESKESLAIIGPRSALFSPIDNLGLVVIDEAHDGAYKQEQAPYYQTTRVAAKLASLHSAKLLMGSATPSVVDYYTIRTKGLPIVRMSQSAIKADHDDIKINVVNLKERDNFTKSNWLSNSILAAITENLQKGTQSLVFLNRRGSARVVMCQSCGWQALCPRCDVPLTYHGDLHKLRCHTCGYTNSAPSSCPECKATDIVFKSVGTKAITEELRRLFPGARVARFDSDNLKSERLDQNHKALQDGSIDILVGTQMVTKGLDLPNLSFVGIVAADNSLFFPDYTAEELTYQQLSQVIGRVGRGHVQGSVVIQTYYPESSALKAAITKNYSLFYEQQIAERESFLYPPFTFILKLTCARKSSSAAQKASQNIYDWLQTLPLYIKVIGPAPAFQEKQNDKYHWQIIIKSKKRDQLTSIVNQLPAQCSYDLDPINLL